MSDSLREQIARLEDVTSDLKCTIRGVAPTPPMSDAEIVRRAGEIFAERGHFKDNVSGVYNRMTFARVASRLEKEAKQDEKVRPKTPYWDEEGGF